MIVDWLDYREKLGIGFCDEEKFQYFKLKIFNVLNSVADSTYSGFMECDEYYEFCNTTGISLNLSYSSDYCGKERLNHCLSVIERTNSLVTFLAYYIAFVNSTETKKSSGNRWNRIDFSNLLCRMLKETHIPFDLIENNEEYFVFPKGAEELDDALVSEPLNWLEDYPDAHKAFIKALKAYSEVNEDNASDVADLFRKTLETFFQEFFGGGKSLENYKSDYGAHLKTLGVPKEISGNLETLLQAYTNYMNNYAKHRDATSDTVLEYLMYQTGNIIRLLITLKGEK